MHFALKLVQRPFSTAEKVADPLPQSDPLRRFRSPLRIDPGRRRGLSILQSLQVQRKIGHPEGGQTGLPGTKEIAWSAHLQILFRDLKSIGGLAEGFQALQRFRS